MVNHLGCGVYGHHAEQIEKWPEPAGEEGRERIKKSRPPDVVGALQAALLTLTGGRAFLQEK